MFNEQQASAWKSEEMFRLLVSGVKNYAIVLLDTDGRVRSWNEGVEGIFGFSREEIIGQPHSKFYSEDECLAGKPEVQIRLARIAGRFNEIAWRVRKNGTHFHASVEITALRNKKGKLTGFGQLICDISDQKDAEERLRKSEEMFRLLVSGVEDYAIVMLNPVGEIVSWNEGVKRIKGYSSEEILGKHFSCFYLPEDIAAARPQTELEVASKNGRLEVEGWRVRKDQSRFRAHVVITALHDSAGNLVGFGKVTRDISLQEAAEKSLKQARDQAEEASRLKSQFLANMSHEIRTPMNGILGITDILIRSDLTDKQRQILKTLQDVGTSMLAVINDILDFSKVEAGKLSLQSEEFSIAELIDGIKEMFSMEASHSENKFTASISADVPALMVGDSGRLRQVLINLIGNANKFTGKGNILLTVSAAAPEKNEQTIEFKVTDDGIGISKEQIARLFAPFVQGDGATTRKYGGTGLGLSISKSLVELMRGEIGAESELGKGSTFWFRVPLLLPSKKRRRLLVETTASSSGFDHDRASSWQIRSDSAILVVEDNPVNTSVILMELAEFGLSATAVANGKEAVEAFSRNPYDLILMDCQMPEMDGWQATNQIRAMETNGRRVPIIALTAQALEGDREKCLAAGMDDYLSKPINFAKLEQILKRWMPLQEVAADASSDFSISLINPAAAAPTESEAHLLSKLHQKYGSARSQQLVGIFIQSSQQLLQTLAQAISQEDASDMRRCAHELVGSCLVLGADEMANAARQIEKMEPIDLTQAQALLESATRAFNDLKLQLAVKS